MKSEWCTIDQFDKAEKVAPRRMRLAFQLLSLLLVDLHFLLSHARNPLCSSRLTENGSSAGCGRPEPTSVGVHPLCRHISCASRKGSATFILFV